MSVDHFITLKHLLPPMLISPGWSSCHQLNTFTAGLNQVVRAKTAESHMTLREQNSGAESTRELLKHWLSKWCSLQWKKFSGWGLWIFCEWHHKWKPFRPPWPSSPGPGPKLLDGSISLKFLLETRLKSESFWYFGWPAGVSSSKVMN